jgi:hypothetical protein
VKRLLDNERHGPTNGSLAWSFVDDDDDDDDDELVTNIRYAGHSSLFDTSVSVHRTQKQHSTHTTKRRHTLVHRAAAANKKLEEGTKYKTNIYIYIYMYFRVRVTM